MEKDQIISEMLLLPISAIDYHVGQQLIQFFPDKTLIEGEAGDFNLEGYAQANECALVAKTFLYNQMSISWQGPGPEKLHPPSRMMPLLGPSHTLHEPYPRQHTLQDVKASTTIQTANKAWFDVHWHDHLLDVLLLRLEGEGI